MDDKEFAEGGKRKERKRRGVQSRCHEMMLAEWWADFEK